MDETGININGKRHWPHCASNDLWTDFFPHQKRGCEAMNERGILPRFKGVLCHDHWKPYYRYKDCLHSLCNAHHLRELTRAHEQDEQQRGSKMKALLEEINNAVHDAGGCLNKAESELYRIRYKELLTQYESDVLRFMDDADVPFTNNQGERDIRMTKVQQKISGCFRSLDGAEIFCRVRSYLSTCRKHGMSSSKAMELLFEGRMPDFIW